MKKRLLSVLLCLCMVASLIPGISVFALEDSPTYKEYSIAEYDLAHVQEVLSGVATVTEKNDVISIKLTDDLFGRLSFAEELPGFDGDFILDLNGHTIDPGNLNEAICLDIHFDGSLTITGSGTIKPGLFNCLYEWGIDFNFALEEGYEYYTLTVGGSDRFDAQNTTTKSMDQTDDEVIITQYGNTEGEDETYTVTFDANGHGTAPVAYREVDAGAKISAPTAPEADGYTFGGWYKEAGCQNAWIFETDTVTADTTLYALWTEDSDEPVYADYVILSHDLAHVEDILGDYATITEDGDNIIITLTENLYGRLHLGGDFMGTWHGNFVLDLNGKKIETDNSFGEAICLDNNFRGQLTITGSGIIKGGMNQIIFTSFAGAYFALSEGYDYYTVEINGEDAFDGENTETKSASVAYVTTGEIVITQANQEEGGGNEGGNEGGDESVTYTDYQIKTHSLSEAEDVLGDLAEVSEDGDNIVIKLTSDINGRLHFGNGTQEYWEGDFILDLNGFTIEEDNTYGEALCLDNDFRGTVTVTGNGTIKGGRYQIAYIGSGYLYFAVADGYDYFTAKVDDQDLFTYEKNYETKERDTRIYGDELVITQGIGLPVRYTVTFNANGYGTAPEAVSVIEGRRISPPDNSAVDGYIFKGWYKEATCENAWDFYNDTVTEDTTLYARWVEASTPPDGYTSDANRIMAYAIDRGTFDINGFFGNEWKQTSWDDAYYTYLKVGDETENVDATPSAENGYDVLDMNVALDFNFTNSGRTLQLVYTVKNNSDAEKTFSLGSGTDIQIGSDDSAYITEFEDGSGFKMVSDYSGDMNDRGEYAQFNFFGKGAEGVTDVTSFWYGPYSSDYSNNGHYWSSRDNEAVFFDNEFSESGDFDSAATWHWTDTLDAGETETYSILIGIGGEGSENLDAKIITFDANGGTVTPADALTEADGTLASLPTPTRTGRYTFNGWFTSATGGDEVTTSTVFEADATIYAQWTRMGGGALSAVTVPSKDPKPEADEKESTTPVTPATPVAPTFFKDVNASDWFYGDIQYVFENGLMNGVSEDTFSPNAKLTRAMLVTVLYRMEGEPATNRSIPFADLDMGAYYASAVIWAQQNGIINGVSETMFAPNKDITREQMAAIMHRYAQYKGYDVSVGENTNILSYNDATAVSEYAVGAMQYACGSGIINGKSAATLAPQDNATRAEAAAILHRFADANK